MNNPFNMVLSALWAMLLAHPAFARDVKQGNRIRFDNPANRDPLKGAVQASDLPEVCIGMTSGNANIMETSSTSRCTRVYTIMVSTGDYRYTDALSLGNIEWYVFAALCGWKKTLGSLLWKDKNFVKRANVVGINLGLSDPEKNRNIKGWSAVWSVEVEMHLQTEDLLDKLAGDRNLEN